MTINVLPDHVMRTVFFSLAAAMVPPVMWLEFGVVRSPVT